MHRQTPDHTRLAYVFAITGGALLWIVTSLVSGRSEAWDAPLYWSVAYPLAVALSGVLGYTVPRRPWRWALAVMLVQPVVMIATTSGSGSMLPLGLVLFGILSLPAIGAAMLGAFIRARAASP